ncbi:hypothetical protein [Streptomyces sp. NPDC056600]|uniref:hypothetical protein n=1 Tax=Streptomyces sp. NPDC056600 TaxID=3345874 RepID=UPI00368A530A
MPAAAEEAIRAWLEDVRSRAGAALLLAGGELGPPLDRRPVLAEVFDPGALAGLLALTTRGAFTGDVCRCLGSVTVALLDQDAEFTASASLHGTDTVSWERTRFRNDLTVADPAGLAAWLRRAGLDLGPGPSGPARGGA